AGDGMVEGQPAGVESQPLVRPAAMRGELRLIARVAEDRMASFGEVDPNLVAAASLQPDDDLREALQPPDDFVVRDGSLSDLFIIGGEAGEVLVRGEERVEGPFVFFDRSGDERGVF